MLRVLLRISVTLSIVFISLLALLRVRADDIAPPDILSSANCLNPCWLGLETEIATYDDVQSRFQDEAVRYSVFTTGDNNRNIALAPIGTSNMIFISDGVVHHISIKHKMCVVPLLAAYGTPSSFSITTQGSFSIFYEEFGMVLYGDGSLITLIEISRAAEVKHRLRRNSRIKPWRMAVAHFRKPCQT